MIVLVCGGRKYGDQKAANTALDGLPFTIDLVVEGGAPGGDTCGREWAKSRGVHCATVRALWDFYGRAAGGKRNGAMLQLGVEYCVALPGGTGTGDMVKKCEAAGIPVWRPYG